MAEDARIATVGEIYAGREGSPFSADGSRTYTKKFRVRLNAGEGDLENRKVGEVDVLSDSRLPQPYEPYVSSLDGAADDPSALCIGLHGEREHGDDWQCWIVTARYSTEMPEGGPNFDYRLGIFPVGPQNQPWDEQPAISWDVQETHEALQYDLNGHPFRNSAGDPFSPPPQYEIAHPVLVVVRNFRHWTAEMQLLYSYAVNDATMLGHGPGFIMSLPPRGQQKWRGPTRYWRMTFRLRFKRDNGKDVVAEDEENDRVPLSWWQPNILDAGFYKKLVGATVPGQSDRIPIYRNNQRVSGHPALLNGEGQELPADGTPVYLPFTIYPAVDLSPIVVGVSL